MKLQHRGSYFAVILILLISLTAAIPDDSLAQSPAPPDKLKKIAPESVVINAYDGTGAVVITFFALTSADIPKPDGSEPKIETTDAVGGTYALPKADIRFVWEATPAGANPNLVFGRLKVDTKTYMEPNIEYKGKLLFLWKDREPQAIDFTIADRSTVSFSLNKEKLDLALGPWQSQTISLLVKNTGKVAITKLAISSDELIDARTQNRTAFSMPIPSPIELQPNEEKEIQVTLPCPTLAGLYSGKLRFLANDRAKQSLDVNLSTRGPIWWGWHGFPLLLFTTIILLSYLLSWSLDNWFSLGGLQRAEATRALLQVKKNLQNLEQTLADWEAKYNCKFVYALPRVALTLKELDSYLAQIATKSQEQLVEEVKRYVTINDQNNLLYHASRLAIDKLSSDLPKLTAKLQALDSVPVAEVATYRAELLKVLQSPTPPADSASGLSTLSDVALSQTLTTEKIDAQIKWKARLNMLFVCLLVFAFGYFFFYDKNFDFGTLRDYLEALIWAFGLTTAGATIVTKLRTSKPPPI